MIRTFEVECVKVVVHCSVIFNVFQTPGGYGGGGGSRRTSQLAYSGSMDDGFVPEYHTGRRYSVQDQQQVNIRRPFLEIDIGGTK